MRLCVSQGLKKTISDESEVSTADIQDRVTLTLYCRFLPRCQHCLAPKSNGDQPAALPRHTQSSSVDNKGDKPTHCWAQQLWRGCL